MNDDKEYEEVLVGEGKQVTGPADQKQVAIAIHQEKEMPTVGKDEAASGRIHCVPDSIDSGCCGSSPAPPAKVPVFLPLANHGEARKLETVAVIMNPFGGNGKSKKAWPVAQKVFDEAGLRYDLLETQHTGHATELANTLDYAKYDALVVIGGDGTINETLAGIMTRPQGDQEEMLPLGFIAGGTGNSVLLSMQALDVAEAAAAICRGLVRPVDVAQMECAKGTFYSVNIIAGGLGASANETAEGLRCFGQMRYDVAALIEIIKNDDRKARLVVDGHVLDGDYVFTSIQNNQHSGVNLRVAPYARLDDGFMDLVVLQHRGRCATLDLFGKLKNEGSHIFEDCCQYYRFQTLEIITEQSEVMNVDGENCACSPCTIKCLKHRINVLYDNTHFL